MELAIEDVIEKAFQNQKKQIPFVMATVVEAIQGTPGRSGFKMLVYGDGSFEGTVGGGLVEQKVIKECVKVFFKQENRFLEFELTEEESGIGMLCGGKAKLFLEYYGVKRKIFLFGAGHLCRSILPILKSIQFYTVVVDKRSDYANPEKLPIADEVYAQDYVDFVSNFNPSKNDSIVIFTHGHENDFDILNKICERNLDVKYIGMIGSRVKAKSNLDKIRSQNHPGNLVEKIYSPIGLNIAKTTTHEIAISITAEILAVYNNVSELKFMRENLNCEK